MPTLESLPTEILNSVVRELVASSYQHKNRPFGKTLRALSRVIRFFAKLCEPYRYRDCSLVRRSASMARMLAKRRSWTQSIQYLSLSIYDCRYFPHTAPREKEEVAEYDRLLARVVRSAISLKQLSIIFRGSNWPLRRTFEACLERKEVRRLRLIEVDDEETCKAAVDIIRRWPALHSIEFQGETENSGLPDVDDTNMQELIRAIGRREDVVEVTYDLPAWQRVGYRELPASNGATRSRISRLRINSEAGDYTYEGDDDEGYEPSFMLGWGLFNLRSIQMSPSLTELEVPLDYLYLAVKETGERLDLHQLRTLKVDTATFFRDGYPPSLDELLNYLYRTIGIFSGQSSLSALHLRGSRSIDVLEALLAKYPIPSLEVVSVSYSPRPEPNFPQRLETLKVDCEGSSICLHLKIERDTRKPAG